MTQTTEGNHRTVDAISLARTPRDIMDAVLGCLAAHDLRGSWGELRGDEIIVLDLGVPDDDAARIEEVLGVPIGAMRFPLAAYPALGTAVRRRTATVEDAFPARMISMFPHLTDAERETVRHHMGSGPLLAAPIADEDAMVGVLFAWGPSVVAQRTLVETLAALAGFAWHRVRASRGRHARPFSRGPCHIKQAGAGNCGAPGSRGDPRGAAAGGPPP